jgi:glycine/D-amino acid oxidase-like deaminating enzyme
MKLITDKGFTVTAKKLIVATGYESLKYIPKKVADIHTTYAVVSEPLGKDVFWYKDSLVWETSNPYLYFRKVSDNKIVVGGKDDEFHRPVNRESVIKRKAAMLADSFCKRVQHIPLKADYSWCGAFAVTKDGLPYIGTIPQHPNTYFALGYGGNGITFSVIAAQIIKDVIAGKKDKNAAIFDFNR